ncbi:MAG: nuclear transport factor 2 family protein [Bacteroidota bacterium]
MLIGYSKSTLVLLLFIIYPLATDAQDLPQGEALERIILKKDSVFWEAYNTCDLDLMLSFVDEDVEFYHDKGGRLNTRGALRAAMQNGLCRSGSNTIERRPVANTIKVFPIAGVGAILRGQHTFHGKERSDDDGIAYFFHLWEYKEGTWQMTRVFSYDHAPIATASDRH